MFKVSEWSLGLLELFFMLHTPTLMEIHERGQKNEKYRFIHRVRWGGGRQKSSRWNKNLPGRRTNSREKWGKNVCFFYPDSRQVTRVLSWFFFFGFYVTHTRRGQIIKKSTRRCKNAREWQWRWLFDIVVVFSCFALVLCTNVFGRKKNVKWIEDQETDKMKKKMV